MWGYTTYPPHRHPYSSYLMMWRRTASLTEAAVVHCQSFFAHYILRESYVIISIVLRSILLTAGGGPDCGAIAAT